MKKLIFWGVLLTLPAFAFADTVSMKLVGTDPNGTSRSLGGVYTSPYQFQINGATTPILALACDDFTTDISIGLSWYANVNTLAAVTPIGPQKFTGLSLNVYDAGEVIATSTGDVYPATTDYTPRNVSASAAYAAAGYLVYHLLFDSSVYSDASMSEDYSYAIWEIFDPDAYLGGLLSRQPLNATEIADVNTDIDYGLH